MAKPKKEKDENYLQNEKYWGDYYADARSKGDYTGMQYANDEMNMVRGDYGQDLQFATADIDKIRRQSQAAESSSPSSPSGGGFTYADAPAYLSKYDQQIQDLSNALLNRPAFSYDADKDPLYAIYSAKYDKAGDDAMRNTLARSAANTGGLANSYSVAAGQLANQDWQQRKLDMIPELQEMAYRKWMGEGDQMRANLNMLLGLDDRDYGRYGDRLGQWNRDRDFAYRGNRDSIADQRYMEELLYGRGRDQLADQRYDQEWQHGLDREGVEDSWRDKEWQHAMEREAIDDARYEDEKAYKRQQDALAASRKGSGGGGGGGDKASKGYKSVLNKAEELAKDDLDAAKGYIERMVDAGYITPDEGVLIWEMELGGGYEMEANPIRPNPDTGLYMDNLPLHPINDKFNIFTKWKK